MAARVLCSRRSSRGSSVVIMRAIRNQLLCLLAPAVVVVAGAGAALGAPTVSVTSPTNGQTVSDPVQVVASATPSSGTTINHMEVWFNGVKVYSVSGASINTSLNLTVGTNERFVVQAIDSTGAIGKVVEYINVTSGTGSPVTRSVPPPTWR